MTARTVRARVVLEEARVLGLDLTDLLAAADADVAIPTVAEFVATIAPTFTAGTAATYCPYWRLIVDLHGGQRLAELDVTTLQQVVDAAVKRASNNRAGSTGRASAESCIAALRALYQRATAAGLITVNPARALTKPRRPRPRRRALDEAEQADLINATRATSLDPDLDLLIIRFHLETGARRSGALALGRADLEERRATVWLTEKGSAREQPISPTLLTLLERHHAARAHGDPGVLRRRDGRPVTARDYDRLFATLAPYFHGHDAPQCRRTCSATRRSPRSPESAATQLPKRSRATPVSASPTGTSTRDSLRWLRLSP